MPVERHINVHLTFAYGPRAIRPWLVGAMLLLAVGDLASESVTMTTFYPAPSGVYVQMITTGNTYLARDTATTAGKVAIGTPTPNSSVNALLSVNGGIAVGDYGTSTYNTAPAKGLIVSGPVGIGKNNPGVALDVVGQAQVSGNIAVGGFAAPGNGIYMYVNAASCTLISTPGTWGCGGNYPTRVPGINISGVATMTVPPNFYCCPP